MNKLWYSDLPSETLTSFVSQCCFTSNLTFPHDFHSHLLPLGSTSNSFLSCFMGNIHIHGLLVFKIFTYKMVM